MPDESPISPHGYALVAVSAPLDKLLTYRVPAPLCGVVAPGVQVILPLGKKRARGYVVETVESTEITEIKEILECPSGEPRFTEKDLEFYQWVARYYHYPFGKALHEMIPDGKEPRKRRGIRLKYPLPPLTGLSAKQAIVLEYLKINGSSSLADLRLQVGSIGNIARALIRKGLAEEIEIDRGALAAAPAPSLSAEMQIILNSPQAEALKAITAALAGGIYTPFLLHGVTGSGKTEVYLQAIKETLRLHKTVIYIVPEIVLTPQLVERVRGRFPGESIATLHSGVSETTRFRQWQGILKGRIRIILGARSAIFAPVEDLGLIIVDEEHDPSYKQDDRLKYNARDLALVKGRYAGATVVLGSATPDIQTCHNALTKKYSYLSLPERVLNRPLPLVEIIDLKRYGGRLPFSEPLTIAIRRNLAASGQTLLFLNRRGFNTLVVCAACGYVFRCRQCSISLTYHRPAGPQNQDYLKCHHCDYTTAVSEHCPRCQGISLKKIGVGTEKIEEECRRAFPCARIARMDRDTMKGRESHQELFERLGRGDIDILVGTQMITKGHDFPGVTLVGVILADISLNLPDFRASERTCQLLTQVSGRGGRGDLPGQVFIQTFNPDHYAIRCARDHDYGAFYREEIGLRRNLGYPPFSRFINFHLSTRDADGGGEGIKLLGTQVRELCKNTAIEAIGPAESPLGVIKGRHRWQLLLKGQNLASLHNLAKEVMALARGIPGIEVQVDVDPLSFM